MTWDLMNLNLNLIKQAYFKIPLTKSGDVTTASFNAIANIVEKT